MLQFARQRGNLVPVEPIDYWWDLERNSPDLPEAILSRLQRAEYGRAQRLEDIASLAFLYERDALLHPATGQTAVTEGTAPQWPGYVRDRFSWMWQVPPSFNIVHSTTNALVARLFGELPDIEVEASGAGIEERRAAEDRAAALKATINRPQAKAGLRAFGRDGVLKGWGAARPVVERGEVRYRRIHQYQLHWDAWDGRDGSPTMLHFWERVPRRRLLAMLARDRRLGSRRKGELMAAVRKLSPASYRGPWRGDYWGPYDWDQVSTGQLPEDDAVIWCESWLLPEDTGDRVPREARGRHVITLTGGGGRGVVLHDGEWERTTFPIVWWSPWKRDEGCDGIGIGHVLAPWQAVVDRTVMKIQRALDQLSHTKVLVPRGTVQNLEDFLAMGISVVEVEAGALGPDGAPSIIAPSVLNAEEVQWLDRVLSLSRSEYGINQMLMSGMSQLGANAPAVALVEEDQRQRDRLSDIDAAFDLAMLEIARETQHAIDDAIRRDGQFRARWQSARDGRIMERPWSELSRAGGELSLEPVGVLGRTRAGRIAKLNEMAQRGILDPALAQDALLSSPDIRRAAQLQMAGRRLVEAQVADLLAGEDVTPDDNVPAQLGATIALQHIQLGLAEGMDEGVLQRLIAYRMACTSMVKDPDNADNMNAPAPTPRPETASLGAPASISSAPDEGMQAGGPVSPLGALGKVPL